MSERDDVEVLRRSLRVLHAGTRALQSESSLDRAVPALLAALSASLDASVEYQPGVSQTPDAAWRIPVTAGTQRFGELVVQPRTPEAPDDAMLESLRAVAAQLAHLAACAQTQRELQHERHALGLLNEIGRRLGTELDVDALAQSVTDVATQITGAAYGAFFYTVSDDTPFAHYTVSGLPRSAFAKFGAPRATALFGPTLNERRVVRIADVVADPRYGKNHPHKGIPTGHPAVRSYLSVPVITPSGRTIGGLFFGHGEPARFTEREQQIAVQLASSVAIALDSVRLVAEQQRLIKELEKTNVELDQFAYAASHDLRAPLRGISNLAGWIEEDLGDATPPKVREHVAMLKGRASRMDRLISGLLELARVGRVRQKAERVDVTELLHDTIDLLSPPEQSRILVIGAMPTLVAERIPLQQVFLNLIGNAVQHGGRTDIMVRVSCVERADEYEFVIADNGVGIAPEHHERVWQMFQTLQPRDVVESTGIGLSIVKKQVEAHGGRAWIDAAVTTGATLRFTWPKRPP